jgi:hypothetical protein
MINDYYHPKFQRYHNEDLNPIKIMQAALSYIMTPVLFNFSNDVVVTQNFSAIVSDLLLAFFKLTPFSVICWIYGLQSGSETVSCPDYIDFPLILSFHQCNLLIFILLPSTLHNFRN